MFFEIRMREIGLVAAGDHHGGPVAGPDVRQGHQHVDLAALKTPVVKTELGPLAPRVAAGMQTDGFAGTTQVREIFIDKKRPVGGVESPLAAHESFDLLQP